MSCGKLPVIGYTEFNEITYNYLKSHFNFTKEYKSVCKSNESNKKFISWNVSNQVLAIRDNPFYLCHKSGRQYYNWQELTDQKQIYELW